VHLGEDRLAGLVELLAVLLGERVELDQVVLGALGEGCVHLLVHVLAGLLEVGHDDLLEGLAVGVDDGRLLRVDYSLGESVER